MLELAFADEMLAVSRNGGSSWRRETKLVGGDLLSETARYSQP